MDCNSFPGEPFGWSGEGRAGAAEREATPLLSFMTYFVKKYPFGG
jgi:hypothetical protein